MEEVKMEVLADGRTRRTRTEWVEIIERFDSTSLRTTDFCRNEKISRSSLSTWRRKLKGKTKGRLSSKQRTAFIELAPAPVESPSFVGSGCDFELSFPGGVTLRWKG
jgi:hypothetical protein